jgi:hypothetical protein
MARYFYSWAPLVVLGAIVMLALPWLAVFALVVFALVALAALGAVAMALVYVPYVLGRAISHRWHIHGAPSPQTALVSSERRSA